MPRYRIMKIGHDEEMKDYTSPSEVLGQLSKGEGMYMWAASEAIEYIKKESNYKNGITDKTLNESKKAWKITRDKMANIGSKLHDLVEIFINIKIIDRDETPFLDYITKEDYVIKQMFHQFYIWQRDNVKRYIESEKPVVHRKEASAGTLDIIYEGFDRLVYCVDLKTSGAVRKNHEIQVVSYKYKRESMYGNYKIEFNQDDRTWCRNIHYDPIIIDECAILRISQKIFDLQFKKVREVELKWKAYKILLSYFYVSAKRKLNNIRAKNRE